jgi:hypothetical protein
VDYRIQPPPTPSDVAVDLFLDYDPFDGEPAVCARTATGAVHKLIAFSRDGRFSRYCDLPADIGFQVESDGDDSNFLRERTDYNLPLAEEVP